MATPTPATPAAAGDPTQQTDDTGTDTGDTGGDDNGGFTIEITVTGDGAITLSVESASDESGEGEGEGEDNAQPVKDAKTAGQLVTDIINNGGQVAGDVNADKQSGFNSVFQGGANG